MGHGDWILVDLRGRCFWGRFGSGMGISKKERIQRYIEAVQGDIVNCSNEQPYEDGKAVWTFGYPTDVADLMMSHGVPEELQEEVAAGLECPECGSPLELWQDVGTKHNFEVTHEETVEKALRKYGGKLFEFDRFLVKFPLLGATHAVGKRILKEMRKARGTTLDKREWFRAKCDKTVGFGPTPSEIVPDQRFNSSGQSYWYLSDNADTAVAELRRGKTAWVQRFEVEPLDGLLDLRAWRADDDRAFDSDGNYKPPQNLLLISLIYCDLLAQTAHAEISLPARPEKPPRQWKPEYLLPRFVAEAALYAGFSGIRYRSVRAFNSENLVVFNPQWNPRSVGEPTQITLSDGEMEYQKGVFFYQGEPLILPEILVPEILAEEPSQSSHWEI